MKLLGFVASGRGVEESSKKADFFLKRRAMGTKPRKINRLTIVQKIKKKSICKKVGPGRIQTTSCCGRKQLCYLYAIYSQSYDLIYKLQPVKKNLSKNATCQKMQINKKMFQSTFPQNRNRQKKFVHQIRNRRLLIQKTISVCKNKR